MNVDDKITYEFYKGWITATAYRLYLKPLFETPASPQEQVAPRIATTHQEKAQELHVAITSGEFTAVDDWEKRFVSDQRYIETPSDTQKRRLDMIWGRFAV
jgi:hypothetical protein